MVISFSHRFIFSHVGRTAGSAIAQSLQPVAHHPEKLPWNRLLQRFGIPVNHFGPQKWKMFRRHASAQVLREQLPPGIFDGFFKFAFVRNPWDWLVSQCRHIRDHPAHHRHHKILKMGDFGTYLRWEAGSATTIPAVSAE